MDVTVLPHKQFLYLTYIYVGWDIKKSEENHTVKISHNRFLMLRGIRHRLHALNNKYSNFVLVTNPGRQRLEKRLRRRRK